MKRRTYNIALWGIALAWIAGAWEVHDHIHDWGWTIGTPGHFFFRIANVFLLVGLLALIFRNVKPED